MMTETWKQIIGYEGLYEVSDLGRVKSLTKTKGTNHKQVSPEKIMSPKDNGRGYQQLCFTLNSCKKHHYVHRLVAEAFIGKLTGKEVNHKDGNKLNNAVYNLEIVTRQQNESHAWSTGLKKMTGKNHKLSKPVIELDLVSNQVIKVWDCVRAITLIKLVDRRAIVNCCNGKRLSAYGSKWVWDTSN